MRQALIVELLQHFFPIEHVLGGAAALLAQQWALIFVFFDFGHAQTLPAKS